MEFPTLYLDWADAVDLTKTRITRFPSLIFLCGGNTSQHAGGFLSCRGIFYNYIQEKKPPFHKDVLLAEKTFHYFNHSDEYKDLLLFESDLAELSSLTIIFSESPGSIAELGSFAVLETIQDKLLIVIHEDDAEKESFIWRGPASYLSRIAKEKSLQNPIAIYNWKKLKTAGEVLQIDDFADSKDLDEDIQKILDASPKSELFKKEKLGHLMLFILDFLKIVRIATLEQINLVVSHLEINFNKEKIKQILSLLTSLKFARKKRYSHNVYYLSGLHKPWITWSFKKTAKTNDIRRWTSLIVDSYLVDDKQKARALRSFMDPEDMAE